MPAGPGFSSPLEASKAPQEEILYVICISPDTSRPDCLAVVNVNPSSPSYSQVINRLPMPNKSDELHHFGWNACSSCHDKAGVKRDKLIIPSLGSDRVYVIDTSDPQNPHIFKVIEPEEMHALGVGTPHTTHCLPNGQVMISTMGDPDGNPSGDFILLDSETWKFTGLWTEGKKADFGYDFWYQPYWDIMVSTEWAAPKSFKQGFHPSLDPKISGRTLNFFSWKNRKLIKSLNLGIKGIFPLEVRFLHNPKASVGFVGCASDGNIYRIYRKEDGDWDAEIVVDIPHRKVKGWRSHDMTGLITDILISMDDRYLFLSNWFHGDVRQYDITDTSNPKLVGQLFVGGLFTKGSSVTLDDPTEKPPEPVILKGRRVEGGPQMLQLSLDGKRLYVTTSLFSKWDQDIYPDMFKNGSALLKVNVDNKNGGLTLDSEFVVHFGLEPDGPMLAHECRYPGGDCTSDIFVCCSQ